MRCGTRKSVEFIVRARERGIEFGQLCRTIDDQLHNQHAQPEGRFYFERAPRNRSVANRFYKELKGFTRCQPWAMRADNNWFVVGDAGPFHCLLRLRSEPKKNAALAA